MYGANATCTAGKCVQCATNADCDTDETCSGGVCITPCTQNEECPALNACESGLCVEKGCTTDRECVGILDNRLAKCGKIAGSELKQCQVPCETNAECSDQELCVDNVCTFIGCTTNDECRALLGLANENSSNPWIPTAVCK
jgi:hypothetical protein